MEDTHGEIKNLVFKKTNSLNPYYNGRYSWRRTLLLILAITLSLNPYYNGRYSWSLVLIGIACMKNLS